MKPKLFLNSTDVANITGYSQRNARNIMEWIRTEKNLSSHQAISIFHFCECFDFPSQVVYEYINNKDFKLLPLNEYDIKRRQSLNRYPENQSINIDMEVFKPIINVPRITSTQIEKAIPLNVKTPNEP